MLKDLLKEGGLYTIANILTKGVSLLLIPFYTAYFTTAEYGNLGILGIFGALAGAIISFQIYQGMGRFIASGDISKEDKQKIGSTAILFSLISYSAFGLIAFVFKDLFIDLLSGDVRIEDDTFLLSVAVICINAIFYALGVQLKFLRKVTLFAIISFLHSIINILLILFFAMKFDYGINSVFLASIVISPILILVQIYYLKDYLRFYIGKKELNKLFKFSIPLIPAAIAYLVLNFIDRWFIKDILSTSDMGVYEVAFKFASIVSLVIIAFQSALAPILYEKHQNISTKKELTNIFNLFIGVGTLGVLILSFFSYETLYIFTQPEYYPAESILPIFYITTLVTGLGMFSPGLHVKQKTRYIPVIVGVSGAINIILNYFMITSFGLIGAAVSTLISVLINNISLFVFSQITYGVPYRLAPIYKALIVFTLFIAFGCWIKYFFEINYILLLSLKTLLIIGYFLFLLKIQLINWKTIRQ